MLRTLRRHRGASWRSGDRHERNDADPGRPPDDRDHRRHDGDPSIEVTVPLHSRERWGVVVNRAREGELTERAFEPFFRGPRASGLPGFGLGLPFARAVARAHGGELSIGSSSIEHTELVLRTARPRLANARAIPLRDAAKAKDDGRLPMTDHNTRIFVVGESGADARAVAEAISRDAFHNVSFFGGGFAELPELATRDAP
jgi:rhodanese-related sulfurtransferase